MKKITPIIFFILICGVFFAGHSTAFAWTIWEPISSKVEFTLVDNGSTGDYQFALFDDVETSACLHLFFDKKTSETVNFSQLPNSSDWQAKNPPDSIILTNSGRFRVEFYNGSEWIEDTVKLDPVNGTYTLSFGANMPELNIDNSTPAPVPNPVFLLGAGLIGLVGFRRVRR